MWFKHLHLYRVHDQPNLDEAALEQALSAQLFQPVSKHEAKRTGFSAPGGRNSTRLVHEIAGQRLLRLRRQERVLPTAVVNEEVEERCAEFETANGFAPPRREKQAIKEKVVEELLPRAFTRNTHTDLWWDTQRSLMGIACASRKRGDEVLDLLRQALGSLKVTPVATKVPVGRTLTQWLSDPSTRPDGLTIGDNVELRGEDDGVLRARAIDLESDEIQTALASGRQVSRLALQVEGELSFVLQDDVVLKSLKFDDHLLDEADSDAGDGDSIVRLETEFALMSNALGKLTDALLVWLGGENDVAAAPWDHEAS
ncbi:recombination-associated protein RdgC [Carnimonas bestiolae]|uniref:recombination-associated protein RdgC n=1 Tax=Carnimonas bestiolae TaxID=3402172 RepID=UPI003EDBC434